MNRSSVESSINASFKITGFNWDFDNKTIRIEHEPLHYFVKYTITLEVQMASSVLENPVRLSWMKHNGGWNGNIAVAESSSQLQSRLQLLSNQLLDPVTSAMAVLRLEAIGNEEAIEILKVIDREESEGSLLNFDFTACSKSAMFVFSPKISLKVVIWDNFWVFNSLSSPSKI